MPLTKVTYAMIDGAVANVLDFGAVGDGIADDTSAIQAALTASDAVYFPSGTYLISDTLKYKTDNYLFGDGDSSVIKLGAALTKNMFYPAGTITGAVSFDNVVFKDLCLDHNFTGAVSFASTIMTIVALSVKHFTVENVQFKNPMADCIYVSKTYGSDSSTVIPYDLKIVNNRFSGTNINRNGISVITGEEILIDGNHFYQITKADMPGPIDLEPNTTSQTIYNVCISNNTFNGCRGGVTTYITGTTYSDVNSIRNISIIGNNFYNQYAISPYVPNVQQYIAVYNASNVTVQGNNLYSPKDLGIVLGNSAYINCSNNNIVNAYYIGIDIKDIADSKVDNNTITVLNDTANGSACIGINVDTNGLIVGDNQSFVNGSLANNTIIGVAGTPASNAGLIMQGNVYNVQITGIISGFKTGVYFGTAVSKGPSNIMVDMDVTQNTVPYVFSYGVFTPKSVGTFNLGENLTYGTASFSASTTKSITGLPVFTTSVVQISRVGGTSVANGLGIACPANGQITAYSSGAESGTFTWKVLQL